VKMSVKWSRYSIFALLTLKQEKYICDAQLVNSHMRSGSSYKNKCLDEKTIYYVKSLSVPASDTFL
jgi:hypothetical protein